MTTTPTTDLQGILSAKKAELTQPQLERGDVIDVDPDTGEIVSAAGASVPPSGEGHAGAAATTAVDRTPAPAPPTPDYSLIPAKVLGGIPYATEYARLAKTICNTEMVPITMRGAWDKVMAAFMRGYEMGLGPMQSLDSFNVIEGKVGLKAEAMRALIMDAGHQIILEDIYGDDGEVFAIEADCHRLDWPDEQWRKYRYSMTDALKADLLRLPRSGNKGAWQKTPRAMLDARATSGAARRYFADVLAGMSYTPEEIRDFDGPQEEATTSRNGNASASTPPTSLDPPRSTSAPSSPEQTAPSSSPQQETPSPASAPEGSSDAAPASPPDAGSTDGASATSSEAGSTSAPNTPSSTPKKASGSRKKAAGRSTPAPSVDAPPAPPPEASTPLTAQDSTPETALRPTEGGGGSPTTPPDAPATSSGSDQPGEGAVLSAMRSALAECIKGQPQVQQPLIRAFLFSHFPQGAAALNNEADLQKCIDIAVGWPDSADQHPIPEPGAMF